jgi:hypothetical protein
MNRWPRTLAEIALLLMVGCSKGEDLFEDIVKLRGIGVTTTPVVAMPSMDSAPSTVKMVFYAAAPLDGAVTAAPYTDQIGSSLPQQMPLTIDSIESQDYASLRLYKVNVTAIVPSADKLYFEPSAGFARAPFAIELQSPFGSQRMVGNLVIYPMGSPLLASRNNKPTVSITTPLKNATIGTGKQDIAADLTHVNDESYRVGWYVSGGAIDNRNAIRTKWDPKTTGKFTVIVTARGSQTAAFAVDVADVLVQ